MAVNLWPGLNFGDFRGRTSAKKSICIYNPYESGWVAPEVGAASALAFLFTTKSFLDILHAARDALGLWQTSNSGTSQCKYSRMQQ
jgi:hypothetical protein